MNLGVLPSELLYQIALYLSPKYLNRLSLVDNQFNSINQDDIFWINKVKLDYQYTYKPTDLTWQKFYLLLARQQIKEVPLIHNSIQIGIIWLRRDNQLNQIIEQVLTFCSKKIPSLVINFAPIQYYIIKEGNTSYQKCIKTYDEIWKNVTHIEIIDDEDHNLNKLIKLNETCIDCDSTDLTQHLDYPKYNLLIIHRLCHRCQCCWMDTEYNCTYL